MTIIYNLIHHDTKVAYSKVESICLSAVDRGFEPQAGQTKDYKIGISCFFTKHAALRRKSKDWLALNQNNVSEWSDMSNMQTVVSVS